MNKHAALEQECEVEFFTAGGPGGQHRNRVATGVRLRHIPTGTVVTATERRSQAANRRVALERLAERLAQAAVVPQTRYATRPTLASQRRRVDVKRQRSAVKLARRRPSVDE
ncbi:MAG: peptide chain release factor-like protein [Chloroflexota bacterium]|nr:peptide chain release factor-like protein [Chloroflexota bacterium]PLS83638.1 MAG: peptide chain release factor-like protein [Chloroflexota bacterium]